MKLPKPKFGEHVYFIQNDLLYEGSIIDIDWDTWASFDDESGGPIVNVQSPSIGDYWMGYYMTFATLKESKEYQEQQERKKTE